LEFEVNIIFNLIGSAGQQIELILTEKKYNWKMLTKFNRHM